MPAALQHRRKTRGPSGVERGPEAAQHHLLEVGDLVHPGKGLHQGANLPEHHAEGVYVYFFVIGQAAAHLWRHEPLRTGHARHLSHAAEGDIDGGREELEKEEKLEKRYTLEERLHRKFFTRLCAFCSIITVILYDEISADEEYNYNCNVCTLSKDNYQLHLLLL